jgi:hypothetical protein
MNRQAVVNLTGVPETRLWTLLNRAGKARRAEGLLTDPGYHPMRLNAGTKGGRTAGVNLAALLPVVASHGPVRAEAQGDAKSIVLENI